LATEQIKIYFEEHVPNCLLSSLLRLREQATADGAQQQIQTPPNSTDPCPSE
jgi:hypothetical protein